MSLPPGFLDELRTRVSLAQVAGRKVTWDQRKSNQGKGDMWAPCPFHQEKTASFHVMDQKGYYYCFGCHEKGDAISFVQATENVGFMEAVEILCRDAGMTMPARDPQAQKTADRRTQLAKVMEQAVRHYRMLLKTGAAGPARDYLLGRGLAPEAQDRWGIGFAPDGRRTMIDHLTGQGVPEQDVVDAGLAARPDDGGPAYDRFRGRILFPIRDARGRCIALGGRAMSESARAKYLNSPETELFDKGRSLFNHGPAREAAGKGQNLIVAEGYMDVIALSEAGFEATVAPLGTAITADQLQLMWRISPEPIIALDGDKAGLRAAMRVIDLALPLLEAGRTLRFCLMPEGLDPDDLIRQQGAGAMQMRVDGALPLVDLLWRRETEGQSFDSPERKAALDKRLREAISKIPDPSVRSHYGQAIKDLRWKLFRPQPSQNARGGGWRAPRAAQPLPSTRASLLAASDGTVELRMREAVILATLLRWPALIDPFETQLERLDPADPDLRQVVQVLLRGGPEAQTADLEAACDAGALDRLRSDRHVQIALHMKPGSDLDAARQCLEDEFARLTGLHGAARDIAEAEADLAAAEDEGLTWRLSEAAKARHGPQPGQSEDLTEYAVAENGARISRQEKDSFDALLEQISPGVVQTAINCPIWTINKEM